MRNQEWIFELWEANSCSWGDRLEASAATDLELDNMGVPQLAMVDDLCLCRSRKETVKDMDIYFNLMRGTRSATRFSTNNSLAWTLQTGNLTHGYIKHGGIWWHDSATKVALLVLLLGQREGWGARAGRGAVTERTSAEVWRKGYELLATFGYERHLKI